MSVGVVAKREITQRLRGRTFRIATGVMLLAIAASIVIPTLQHGKRDRQGRARRASPARRPASLLVETGNQLGSDIDSGRGAHRLERQGRSTGPERWTSCSSKGPRRPQPSPHDRDTSNEAQLARAFAVLLGEEQRVHHRPPHPEAGSGGEPHRPLPVSSLSAWATQPVPSRAPQ